MLYNFFVPSLCTLSVFLFLSFACPSGSVQCSLWPSTSYSCSEKLQSFFIASAVGLSTCTVLVLGICCVSATFCFIHYFSQVRSVLALTLTPFFLSHTTSNSMWLSLQNTHPESDLCSPLPISPLPSLLFLSFFFFLNFYLFIYFLFIYGCVGSSFLCEGFL